MTTETRAHDHLNEELNAYLDGQLDSARAALVEQHVAGCAICVRELEELRATRTMVRALPALRAPRSFMLPAPEPVVPRWERLLAWGWRLGSVASAACVLMAALTLNQPAQTSFSGLESRASVAKNETPAQQPAPPAPQAGQASQAVQAPQSAQERSALVARDSAASGAGASGAGAAAPGGAPALAPAATQAPQTSVGSPTVARAPVDTSALAADESVTARRGQALPWLPWVLAALLFGAASAYVFTLERRAKVA